MFSFDKYRGNQRWLPYQTIVVVPAGSMAYGTNGPGSDEDYRGVFVTPKHVTNGFLNSVEQIDKGFEELDCALYDIRRFLRLATDNNPNILEILFTEPVFEATTGMDPYTVPWRVLTDHKHEFLSQNVKHRFSGYAVSQLKKIETHRRWLLNPPSHKPSRGEYGLPETNKIPKEQREALEAVMLKEIESWQVDFASVDDSVRIDLMNKLAVSLADMKLSADDQYVAAGNKIGLDVNAMEYLKAERAYRGEMAAWTQYQTWVKERNPARAELERQYGYDTKHGMHLVRLMRMADEMLAGKGLIVKRPDAEELKAIRFHGAWTYEKLITWAKEMDERLNLALASTPLKKTPDRDFIDGLCQDIVARMT